MLFRHLHECLIGSHHAIFGDSAVDTLSGELETRTMVVDCHLERTKQDHLQVKKVFRLFAWCLAGDDKYPPSLCETSRNSLLENYFAKCVSFLSFSLLHSLLLPMRTSSFNILYQGDHLFKIQSQHSVVSSVLAPSTNYLNHDYCRRV